MALLLKADRDTLRQALKRHRRFEVFHWTLASQLPSILEHGLLCRRELEARRVAYEPHGYGRAGKDKEFADFICLSFLPHWGMMGRASGPVAVIELTSDVLTIEGTFYCPGNTARNDYNFDEVETWTKPEDLEDLFTGPDDFELVDRQAEVWVPDRIPVGAMKTVCFRNEADQDNALRACEEVAAKLTKDLAFQVKPGRFPPAMERPADTLAIEDIPF